MAIDLTDFGPDNDQLWRPSRTFAPINNVDLTNLKNQIARLNGIVLPKQNEIAGITTESITGVAPAQILTVSATESPFKTKDNSLLSLVSVSFTVNPADTNFDHVQIWFTGFNGNSNPQLMPGDTSTSPASFLIQTTGETVTVTAVAVASDGTSADFNSAPTCTVTLDGVTSAPPAPNVVQTAVPIFGGVQFAFTEESGLLADVIQCYKVYRNIINSSGSVLTGSTTNGSVNITGLSSTANLLTSMQVVGPGIPPNTTIASIVSGTAITINNNATATGSVSLSFLPLVIDNIPHNPQNAGTNIVVQDNQVQAQQTYFYWVSAVNSSGLESTLTSAGSSAASFAMPTSTQNLLANPDLTGSGILPVAGSSYEVWVQGSTPGLTEYRNNREIRVPAGTSCVLGQYKPSTRFEPGTIVTFSFYMRRGGITGSPTGTFQFNIQNTDSNFTFMANQAQSDVKNVSSLAVGSYTFYRLVATLPYPIGGQAGWFIGMTTTSNDDLYFTKPMLNIGPDSSPYTNNTFLTDEIPFLYEGFAFVSDDFTRSSAVNVNTHYPSANGGGPETGTGGMWAVSFESGSAGINAGTTKAAMVSTTGTQIPLAINRFVSPSVAYSVQADVFMGAGATSNMESGIIGRWTSGGFYLARLISVSGTISVDLFKNIAGTYTQLGTFAPGAVSSGTIKLQITDAAKVVFWNGTSVISSSDNAVTAAGSPGFRMAYISTTALTQVPTVDNFSAFYVQNVAAPPAPPSSPPSSPPPPPTYNPITEPSPRPTGGRLEDEGP